MTAQYPGTKSKRESLPDQLRTPWILLKAACTAAFKNFTISSLCSKMTVPSPAFLPVLSDNFDAMLFLHVPFDEKDEAKALGARWNPTRRRWYVPGGVATAAFAKWAGQGAEGAAGGAAPVGGVDSYQGKTVTGANYVALEHDCNPFETCPQCSAALLDTDWQKARRHLAGLVAKL